MSCCGSSSVADRREGKPYSMQAERQAHSMSPERQAQVKAKEEAISNYANGIVCVQEVDIPKRTPPSGLLTGSRSRSPSESPRSRSPSLQGLCGSQSPSQQSPRSRRASEQEVATLSSGVPLGQGLSNAEGAIPVLVCMGASKDAETLRSALNLPEGSEKPLERQSTVSPTAAEQIRKQIPVIPVIPVNPEYRVTRAALAVFTAFSVPGTVPDTE